MGRADKAIYGNNTGINKKTIDFCNPADVFSTVLRAECKSFIEFRAYIVTIQQPYKEAPC